MPVESVPRSPHNQREQKWVPGCYHSFSGLGFGLGDPPRLDAKGNRRRSTVPSITGTGTGALEELGNLVRMELDNVCLHADDGVVRVWRGFDEAASWLCFMAPFRWLTLFITRLGLSVQYSVNCHGGPPHDRPMCGFTELGVVA